MKKFSNAVVGSDGKVRMSGPYINGISHQEEVVVQGLSFSAQDAGTCLHVRALPQVRRCGQPPQVRLADS